MKTALIVLVVISLLNPLKLGYAQNYELVVLDNSTNESGAYGINSYGFVCGYSMSNNKATPSLWSPNGSLLQLPMLSGACSETGIAYAINDYFEVGGTYGFWNNGMNVYHMGEGTAVVWIFDMTTAGFIPFQVAQSPAMVRDINLNAEVAGQEKDFGFTRNIYDETGYDSYMSYSYCFALNDQGNATGMTISGSNFIPMFVEKKSDGTYTTQTGLKTWSGVTAGTSINAQNQIVGVGTIGGFYWEPKTGSNTSFGWGSSCFGINNFSQIVGATNDHACMWTKKDNGSFSFIDLNQLTGNNDIVLEKAFAINDNGQVVGQCLSITNGVRSAFMLTPSKSVRSALSKPNSAGEVTLSWPSEADHLYRIKVSYDLKSWITVPELYQAGNEETGSVRFTPAAEDKIFFITVIDLTP